jgi:hypothetical protein
VFLSAIILIIFNININLQFQQHQFCSKHIMYHITKNALELPKKTIFGFLYSNFKYKYLYANLCLGTNDNIMQIEWVRCKHNVGTLYDSTNCNTQQKCEGYTNGVVQCDLYDFIEKTKL